MKINENEILLKIAFELRWIKEEISELKSILKDLLPSDGMMEHAINKGTRRITNGNVLTDKQINEIQANRGNQGLVQEVQCGWGYRVIKWLEACEIQVKDHKTTSSADQIYDKLAIFLGERFKDIVRLHDKIRKHLSTSEMFQLNLSGCTQNEISSTTQFCKMLHQYAFLENYNYNKGSRIIIARTPRDGRVINFFTGGWFERFVFLKLTKMFDLKGLDYDYLKNAKIILPNINQFELDLLFLINNRPLWVECKTGDYQNYIRKYSHMRQNFKIPKENSFLVILGLDDEVCINLNELFQITVTNENQFIGVITSVVEGDSTVLSGQSTISTSSHLSGKLSTFLKKARLRPLPEIRTRVIQCLLDNLNFKGRRMKIHDLKSLVHNTLQISKNKIQDILNALLNSGCFLDFNGDTVTSNQDEIAVLVSDNTEYLNQRCIDLYAFHILQSDPGYFNHQDNALEFEHVVGAKAPDIKKIKKIKETFIASGL
ncbi:MAG: hypothetical protein ACTSRA_12915 [Promethearchaeota archaeon]